MDNDAAWCHAPCGIRLNRADIFKKTLHETRGGSIMKKNRHKRRFTKRWSIEFPCEHMLYPSTCLHYRYPKMQGTSSQNQGNQSSTMNVHQWLGTAVSPSVANLLWVRRIKHCLDGEPPIQEWASFICFRGFTTGWECKRLKVKNSSYPKHQLFKIELTHPCNSGVLLPASKYVTVCISRVGSSPINLRAVSSSSWFCCQASWIVMRRNEQIMNLYTVYCPSACVWKCKKNLYGEYDDCILYLTVTNRNEEVCSRPSAMRARKRGNATTCRILRQSLVSLHAFHNSETEWLGWRIPWQGSFKTSSVSLLQLLPLMQALKRR